MTTEIVYLLVGIGFVLSLIAIVTKIVVSHGKPTIINHGQIHNHYYGETEESFQNSLCDRTIPLILEGALESVKMLNSPKKPQVTHKKRRKPMY